MSGCLYRLTFPNNKAYIGISRHSLAWRLRRHRYSLAGGSDTLLYRAWRKYGAAAIKAEVLVVASDIKYLHGLEVGAIAAYRTRNPLGYNMTAGGDGTVDPSHEIITRRRQLGADPAWQAMHRDIQMKLAETLWTAEHRAERGAAIRSLWDGEYGEKLRLLHAGRRVPKPRKVLLDHAELSRRKVIALSGTETRKRMSDSAKRASGSRRDQIAKIQTDVMADVEARLRIARALSPLANPHGSSPGSAGEAVEV
jgi:hypothetical protein